MIDRIAIRREIESTRVDFHGLLESIPAAAWTTQSGNPEMTIKQLMWHAAWAVGWMANSVDAVRSGKSVRVPGFLLEPGRRIVMRWLARNATPEQTGKKYDQGHEALLTKLELVPDVDWSREAVRFGQVRTVAWYFNHVREHFEEHARDVRAVLPAGVVS